MQKCEKCNKYKSSAYRRAEHGKVACDECHLMILRGDSRTGLVRIPYYLRKVE